MKAYKKLRQAILSERIRQIEIAHILGWDPSLLSKILNGWKPLTKENEKQIKSAIKLIEGKH